MTNSNSLRPTRRPEDAGFTRLGTLHPEYFETGTPGTSNWAAGTTVTEVWECATCGAMVAREQRARHKHWHEAVQRVPEGESR